MSIPRITAAEVLSIINTNFEDLSPFIIIADDLVTEELSNLTPALTELRLTEITRWLAAHFITVAQGQAGSESVGDASTTYLTENKGDGLKSTSFGQAAILLDTSGTLEQISTTIKRAYIESLG